MRSAKLYSSLAVLSVVASIFLLCNDAAAEEYTKPYPPRFEADLQLALGLYREGGKYLFPFTASEPKNTAESSEQDSLTAEESSDNVASNEHALRIEKNYSALASINYVMRTRSFGSFSVGLGYSYRVDYLRKDMLKDIKKKVMRDSLPYAQIYWEKKGILLLRKLSLGGGMRLWIKDEKGRGYPLHLSCSLRYGIGDITSIYLGLHMPVDLSSVKFSEGGKYTLLPVIGIEFST